MFLFVSDLHLQRTAWKSREDLYGDAFRAWEEIVRYAVAEKAAAVVLGGDNFDEPRPCSEVVDRFHTGMLELLAHDVEIYFIQGQHCRAIPPWPQIFDAVHLKEIRELDGKPVGALDNMPAQELQAAIAELPKNIKILVLHQLCRHAPCVNWDLDPEWLQDFKDLKLVLMGDLHVPWEKQIGAAKFMYGGSCAMQSVDEVAQKSFIRVEDDLTVSRIPLSSRPKYEFLIESSNDLVRTDAALKALKVGNVAPLVVATHAAGVAVQGLREAHPDKVFMFRPLALMAPAPVGAEVLPSVVSLEKNLDLVVSREAKPALHSFLLAALTAGDAKAVVEAKCSPAGEL